MRVLRLRGTSARARRCECSKRQRPCRARVLAASERRVERDLGRRPRAPSRPGSPPSRPAAASWNAASSMPGTRPHDASSAIFVIPSPGWNVTVADVSSSLRRRARLREARRERHREARGVRGRDQLLGARLAPGLVGRARRPADGLRAERAARRRVDRAAALHQRALPGHVRAAIGAMSAPPLMLTRAYYAITSTRGACGRRAGRSPRARAPRAARGSRPRSGRATAPASSAAGARAPARGAS